MYHCLNCEFEIYFQHNCGLGSHNTGGGRRRREEEEGGGGGRSRREEEEGGGGEEEEKGRRKYPFCGFGCTISVI